MAFSGVTSVKFTAAPGRMKKRRGVGKDRNEEREEGEGENESFFLQIVCQL